MNPDFNPLLNPDTGAPAGGAAPAPVAAAPTPGAPAAPAIPTPEIGATPAPAPPPAPTAPSVDLGEADRLANEAALSATLDAYNSKIAMLEDRLATLAAPSPSANAPATDDSDDPVAAEFNSIKGSIAELTKVVQEIRGGWSKAVQDQNRAMEAQRLQDVKAVAKNDVMAWLKDIVIKNDPDLARSPDKGIAAILTSDVEAYMDGSFRPSLRPHEVQAQAASLRRMVADRIKYLKSIMPIAPVEPVRDQVIARDGAMRDNLTAPLGGSPAPGAPNGPAPGSVHWFRDRLTERAKAHGVL